MNLNRFNYALFLTKTKTSDRTTILTKLSFLSLLNLNFDIINLN